jgi:nucleotide-binding universal stress UspA family protein
VVADYTEKSVVVGIDGSRAAVAAAQWGADEALGREAILRLLYVVNRNRALTPGVVKAQFLVAEAALHDARVAVEATHKAVRIQAEAVDGDPGTTLSEASWSAAVLCVGAPKAAPHGPYDSLAANMATSAHCSVAVVPANEYSVEPRAGWVAALLQSSSDEYDVLERAMEEAHLREFALHVVTGYRRGPTDAEGHHAYAGGSQSDAAIEEHLVNWAPCYPGVDTQIVHTDELTEYVAEHQHSIRLVVMGGEHRREVTQLVELTRSRALHDANFAVYVIRRQHL